MYRHVRNVHETQPNINVTNSAECPLCSEPLRNIRAVDIHLKTIHNVNIEAEELLFLSEEGKIRHKVILYSILIN